MLFRSPIAGLAFGGLLAIVFVRKWTSRNGVENRADEDTKGGDDPITDDMQVKIDEELRKIEED